MTNQGAPLGSVHGTAQRAADVLAVLLPRAGNRLSPGSAEERAALIDVLRAHGEPEPIEISAASLELLRQAALELREVFTAEDVDRGRDGDQRPARRARLSAPAYHPRRDVRLAPARGQQRRRPVGRNGS